MAGMDACVRMRSPKKFLFPNRSLLALLIYNRIFPDIGLNLIMMARIGDQITVRINDHLSSDYLSFNIIVLQAISKIVDNAQEPRNLAGLRI